MNAWETAVMSLIVLLSMSGLARATDQPSGEAAGVVMARQATKVQQSWGTADHTRHEILKKTFDSGPDVTKACLSCHNLAGMQFHKTIHWTWLDPTGDPQRKVGKGGLTVNNFCLSLQSNEPRCTSCHAGYGWKDKTFDFSDLTKIDCLVCHERTGTYKKYPAMSGNPVTQPTVFPENKQTYLPPDWNAVAQSVGRPTRTNCGTCHFFGGGGDGVKHGDLDSSMTNPEKSQDVHMGSLESKGKNFDCSRCHTTVLHAVAGRIYDTPASLTRKNLVQDDQIPRIMCESCHTATPHKKDGKLNDHTDKVACQTCHIPTFARTLPTKMRWDWSTAGKLKDGKPFKVDGDLGRPLYDSKKGDFVWQKNVIPEYHWFNGSMRNVTAKDKIDPSKPIRLNWPKGELNDPNARIMPFKVHTGRTPYDTVYGTMLIPHLFGKDDAAYWNTFDWPAALKVGMEYAGLPFSGEYAFAETEYAYPITHMVAPKDKSLTCGECHSRQGRLAGLAGFYMPGRDLFKGMDLLGWSAIAAALIGITVHGLGRVFANKSRKEERK